VRNALAALAIAAGACLLLASPAGAAVSISAFTVTPASTQAGGSPDVTVDTQFSSGDGDTVKDATLSLAPGLLANPSAANVCSGTEFQAESCPASSQIGDGTITATAPTFGTTLKLPVTIFMLAAQSSAELARIGIIANLDDFPVASISAPVRLRTSPDVGIDIPLTGIPNQVSGIGAQMNEIALRLYGTVDGEPFTRLPTSCAAASTSLSIDSYASPASQVTASGSFTPTGCGSLAYNPHLSATATRDQGDDGVAFDSTITQASGQAATKTVTLTLPSGLSPRLSALSSACSAADLSTCSAVGTATVTTPLEAQPVQGRIVLAAGSGSLPTLDAVFPAPFGLTLQGAPTISSGELRATFSDIPDFPITRLEVDLNGGPQSVLTAGSTLCSQPQTTVGQFSAQNGASAQVSSTLSVPGCPGPSGGASAALLSARFSGLGAGHPKLKLRLAGTSSFAIALPKGLGFKLHHHKGLAVSGAKLGNLKVSRGWLVVTLSKQAASVTVTLQGPLLVESDALQGKVRHHKLKKLTLRFKLDGGATLSRKLHA
jgi:hypothetical protein